METNTVNADDCTKRINKFFEDFIRLYMFVANIEISFHDAEEDNLIVAEYSAEYEIEGYELDSCADQAECLERFRSYPARYEHVVKLSGTGEIHKAHKNLVEKSNLKDSSGDIILLCRFSIEAEGENANYFNLEQVQPHGLTNYHFANGAEEFLDATQKHAELLEFGVDYFLGAKYHMSYESRDNSIAQLLANIDQIAKIVTPRFLQLSAMGDAITILLNAAEKKAG